MLAHSPKARSRSPHRTNGNQTESSTVNDLNNHDVNTTNNKSKKENESQLRMKSLKAFLQTLVNDLSTLGSTSDEQIKALENTCVKEFRDLPVDRIRRMIRSVLKDHPTTTTSSTNERSNTNENQNKKNRSNSTSNNSSAKSSDLATSTLSPLDADFLRHAFSQQFRPSLDLAAYFSAAAAASNNNTTASSLFRPDFSPSNFLQSLTAPPPPLPSNLVSSHTHTNGSYQRTNDSPTTSVSKSSKSMKLSPGESNSIKVLVNAYREAASYLNRSADELEQLV